MRLGGVGTEAEPVGDLEVGESGRDELQNLVLAWGQLVEAGGRLGRRGTGCEARDQPAGDARGQ